MENELKVGDFVRFTKWGSKEEINGTIIKFLKGTDSKDYCLIKYNNGTCLKQIKAINKLTEIK